MPNLPGDPQSFKNFIDNDLDLSALDQLPRLSDDELEQFVMPLIRGDIQRETLKLVTQLLRSPQPDHWRTRLAPLHREMRRYLAESVAAMMQLRYPGRMSEDEWLDAATLIITVAWLVRKQMDDGDPLFPDN